MAENETGFGQMFPSDTAGPFNPQRFVVDQIIARLSTIKIVKVTAVDTAAKTVDVQPMVKQIDGEGGTSEHGTIFGIPYWAWQFGKNVISGDPVAGDIGIMACCDRDISAVKATKAIAPPGSLRQMDMADGIYFGGVLNGAPEQWFKFTGTGTEIADKNGNKLVSSATGWAFTGNVTFQNNIQLAGSVLSDTGAVYAGNIQTSGDVVAGGVSLKTHTHLYLKPSTGATTPTPTAAPS